MNRDFNDMLHALFDAKAEFSSSERMRWQLTIIRARPVTSTSGLLRRRKTHRWF
jgi:hypothetical protein